MLKDREVFDSLEVGDVLELPSLTPKLSADPLVLTLVSRETDLLNFNVTCFGVLVKRVSCIRSETGELQWV